MSKWLSEFVSTNGIRIHCYLQGRETTANFGAWNYR